MTAGVSFVLGSLALHSLIPTGRGKLPTTRARIEGTMIPAKGIIMLREETSA